MKRIVSILLGLALFVGAPAMARLCAIDAVPASTLLVPYFEVDLEHADGINTLFSVNNASASATVAHVVMWTNWSAPTIDFDIYLTGYDVQTVNLRDVFNGNLPVTASVGQDPVDLISPQGPLSQDINFASCTGLLPYNNPVVKGTALDRLINGHTGQPVASLGGRCLGGLLGDDVARGYITIDVANICSLVLDPGFPGYFISGGLGIAGNRNILWGDFFFVDEANSFAQGDTLVHIEASTTSITLNAANIPLTSPQNENVAPAAVVNATNYTFYGRYTQAAGGTDNREPLGTTWAVRYLLGGQFSGGTDLIVWRDSTANNVLPAGATCVFGPNWFPLNETEVLAFDEEEQVEQLCFFLGGVISPPDEQDPACFPYETGRYSLGSEPLDPTEPFGWLYLNLNLPPDAPSGDVDFPAIGGNLAQSWVGTVYNAQGRFSVGLPANELLSACRNLDLSLLP